MILETKQKHNWFSFLTQMPTISTKAGNFVWYLFFRQLSVKILGAPARLSLSAIDFEQKQKDNGLIFYFFSIL
jgi:hypothetical protein